MKKIIIFLFIIFISSPAFAQKIKINGAYNFDVANKPNVKLNEQVIERENLFVIPRGRRIHSRLNDNINIGYLDSNRTKVGDVITTQLMQDWYYQNKMIAPEGSLVKGKIDKIPSFGNVVIIFDTILKPDKIEITIKSKPIKIQLEKYTCEHASIPFNTEFTIQIINDIVTKPYEN